MYFPFAGRAYAYCEQFSTFFFLLGSLGESIPCLRLGRRVMASESDVKAWKLGYEQLEVELKIHLVGSADLLQVCVDGYTILYCTILYYTLLSFTTLYLYYTFLY